MAAIAPAADAQSPPAGPLSEAQRERWRELKSRAKQPHTRFSAAREGLVTRVELPRIHPGAAPLPPRDVFSKVAYPAAAGPLAAYLTPDRGDGKRRAAILWITGGDSNSLDDVWTPRSRGNDQSAAAYRRAGIVMMFPSLRGGNDNPGKREGFFGEIDDVMAAYDFLSRQPHVDPERIYLGGHSTGATLVLLVAAMPNRFRAAFAFGPVAQAADYGPKLMPVDFARLDARESTLRAPIQWLEEVRAPLFVIEGQGGNMESFRQLRGRTRNARVGFIEVAGADHFTVLAPANEAIAQAILQDTGGDIFRMDTRRIAGAVAGPR